MPPEGATKEENELVKSPDDQSNALLKSEVITNQPEKKSELEEIPLTEKSEESFDCLTGFTLCCNALEQCWLAVFSCVMCCDPQCCAECVNGTCEGFTQCLEGFGDCCIHCCQ